VTARAVRSHRAGGRTIARVLILWDIDATLITTTRVGLRALEAAGRELFGPRFDVERVEVAGRLDPLIIRDLLRAHDLPADAFAPLRDGYRAHLGTLLAQGPAANVHAKALPGVMDLLALLRRRDDVTLGLLTGNYRETGSMKLRAAGIDPDWFPIQAWADNADAHAPDRADLPPVGMRRWRERAAASPARENPARDNAARDRTARDTQLERELADAHSTLGPDRVTIIGDTPHDARCALAHQCRALGVATGRFSIDELRAAGFHRVERDLSNTAEVLHWLTSTQR
jgi:phosphoglycolate phosphatase-like HAD superfamily hydrolase